MKSIVLSLLTLTLLAHNSQAFSGGCPLNNVDIQVGSCEDGDPDVVMFFDITGDCLISQICFLEEGIDIGCADVIDLEIGNGQGINFGGLLADTFYEFSVILDDGNEYTGYSVQNGNCDDFICDCVGTQHTLGLLDENWLGDGFADDGTYAYEGQPVDFNCETWGYDCGDIPNAPTADPYDVCNGGIPPNNGCGIIGDCFPVDLTLAEGNCSDDDQDGVLTPTINMVFSIDGTCNVDELCFSTDNGANYDCIDLVAVDQIVFDGQGLNLINTIPDIEYLIYFTAGGNTSDVFSYFNGNCDSAIEGCTNEYAVNYDPQATVENGSCIYNETICDCLGNEHTIGVLTWLGDTFADNNAFPWDGVLVDFNCAEWGYDCGDIQGSPSDDPNGVCQGGLPPNNGCGIIGECSVAIGAVNESCPGNVLEHEILFEVTPGCNYDELCYSVNGGTVVCEDISWVPSGFSYSTAAPASNSVIVYYVTLEDGTVSNEFTIVSGDCENNNLCSPVSMTLEQGLCGDDNGDGVMTPTISIDFGISGDCLVDDICFSIDGSDYTCLTLADFEILVGNGEGINLINTTPDALYSFYFTTQDGVSGIQTFLNGNCEDVETGCTNSYASNYDPNAEVDDNSCIYNESICDCDGTTHTIGVLTWLGDTFEDTGGFFWDGLPVNFNCDTWGYDCGDIEGAPADDPYDVCNNGLPPNNGCFETEDCIPYELTLEEDCLFDEVNNVWVPRVLVTGYFGGDCLVTEVCEEGTFTAINCFVLADFDIELNSGDGVFIPVAGNDTYTITLTTPDGVISDDIFIGDCADATFGCTNPYAANYDSEADQEDGSCIYDETICDCAGTEHTIGVLTWIGDGFEDIGNFNWDEEPVDFNCAIWGFDCGDIDGTDMGDPYGVCDGGLPPNNGCGIDEVFGCTDDEALNYDPQATADDGTCEYEEEVYGCTDPEASNYNPNANVDNGTCEYSVFGCTDPDATNYNPLATIDNGSCIYVDIEGCTDPNANNYDPFANLDDGSCTYGCTLPDVVFNAYCDPENTDGFYIAFETGNLGSGAPYQVTNNTNGQSLILTNSGTFEFGPFENGAAVVMSFTSINTPNCTLLSDVYTQNCSTDPVLGCTDESALNYNPDATEDDGSCVYDCVYPIISYSTLCEPGEDDVFYVEMDIESLGNGAPYDVENNTDDETLSINFNGVITLGPYNNGSQVLFTLQSELYEGCILTSPVLTDDCTPVPISGCTDPLAVNYNPEATQDDGSCEYDFTVCDCVGNVYSPAVLSQLGDGIPNTSIVNFDCDIWGYDCGDIPDSPDEDIYNVCDGDLPPFFGCPDNVEEQIAASLELFPNPSKGIVNLKMIGISGQIQIELYNTLGELVLTDYFYSSDITQVIIPNHLSNGMYFFQVNNGEISIKERIILNR